MRSIAEIKEELAAVNIADIKKALKQYKDDERAGVKKLVESFEKKYDAYLKEQKRLDMMLEYENKYYSKGSEYIAGVDEVGRGPLAGPVMAAAVILPKDCRIEGLNDSKQLSAKKRDELFEIIKQNAVSIGIGCVDNRMIDRVNIRNATHMAMKAAVENLEQKLDNILVDGSDTIPDVEIPQENIIKGDSKSMSVAAASVVAKVLRDRLMFEYAKEYPGYDFENNVGYGTKKHYEGIRNLGLTAIHRFSFCKDVFNEQ